MKEQVLHLWALVKSEIKHNLLFIFLFFFYIFVRTMTPMGSETDAKMWLNTLYRY